MIMARRDNLSSFNEDSTYLESHLALDRGVHTGTKVKLDHESELENSWPLSTPTCLSLIGVHSVVYE